MSKVERDAAGRRQQETVKRKQKDTVEERGIEKKRESDESDVIEQTRQASGSMSTVVDARPEPSLNQSARGPELEECVGAPDALVTLPTTDYAV